MISSNENNKRPYDLLLIVSPPFLVETVPLGVAYLSTYLKRNDFLVDVIDFNMKLFRVADEENKHWWDISAIGNYQGEFIGQEMQRIFKKEIDSFIEELVSRPEKLIGFSTTAASIYTGLYIGHQVKLKSPEKIIILGGPGVYTAHKDIDQERLIDIFVIGEGESPLRRICKEVKNNKCKSDLLGIKGTVVWLDGHYHSFLPQDNLSNIDDIPFPTFSEFMLDDYAAETGFKYLPILTSRGCINRCSYCVDCHMNFPYRYRSPESIVEEIMYHAENNKIEYFQFNDLLCNGNLRQLEKLCDLIIEKRIIIQWSSYAAIREGMTPELICKMKKAGCIYLCYGVESGSNLVLKKMNKRYSASLAEEVIRNTHEAGIQTAINIILGFPGDTEAEFKKTCDFVRKNYDVIDEITNVSTWFFIYDADISNKYQKYGFYAPWSFENMRRRILRKPVDYDFRHFRAVPHNTPKRRKKWLRKFVELIYRLNIKHTIINRVGEDDVGFNDFLNKLDKRYKDVIKTKGKHVVLYNRMLGIVDRVNKNATIAYGHKSNRLPSKDDMQGCVNLSACTMLPFIHERGIDSDICCNGLWYSMSRVHTVWCVYNSEGQMRIRVSFNVIPVEQEWIISQEGNSVSCITKTWCKEHIALQDVSIRLYLSDIFSHYNVSGEWEPFKCINLHLWGERTLPFKHIFVRHEGQKADTYPVLYLAISSNREAFVQIHPGCNESTHSRVIGGHYDTSKSISEEEYFTQENPLKLGIVTQIIPPKSYHTFISGLRRTKNDLFFSHFFYVLEKKPYKIYLDALNRKTSLFYANQGISKDTGVIQNESLLFSTYMGFNTSLCVNQRWYDSSMRAVQWQVKKEIDQIYVNLTWRDIPFTQEWVISCTEDKICWYVRSHNASSIDAECIKAGIYIPACFTHYYMNGIWHELHKERRSDWQDTTISGKQILVSSREGQEPCALYPNLAVQVESSHAACMQLQTAPMQINARMINVCTIKEEKKQQEVVSFDIDILCTKAKTCNPYRDSVGVK